MPLAQLNTRARLGIDAPEVRVEVHIANGLPAFTVVGLPATAVREARDRVRSAIQNSGFQFPPRRITVNLAPADLPKEGGRYDLAIALGILAAAEQIDARALESCACFGELALDGTCRRVDALLPALIASKAAGQRVLIPRGNLAEAGLLRGLRGACARSLAQICASLNGGENLPAIGPHGWHAGSRDEPDLADVRGQHQAKRALEIAAAGEHHLLMMGPPGAGKSMLARRLGGIMPELSEDEAIACAGIRSLGTGGLDPKDWRRRPFQSPHHTVSAVALVGGGSNPRPGEISLAHNGVLFLDELTEFSRNTLEVLREPLETGEIHIARARRSVVFPARFQLVAAMNPCPGGCASIAECDCAPEQLRRYRDKISAPLLDRIDIQLELARPNWEELHADTVTANHSDEIRQRVTAARRLQHERQGCCNARLGNSQLQRLCPLEADAAELLTRSVEKMRLSARSYHKLLRLGRTIADLAQRDQISAAHIAEAVALRRHERNRRG